MLSLPQRCTRILQWRLQRLAAGERPHIIAMKGLTSHICYIVPQQIFEVVHARETLIFYSSLRDRR